jgi:hypothetical protein
MPAKGETEMTVQIDRLIQAAYAKACNGMQIDIMDIEKVFKRGRELILSEKADKAALERGLREFVETIRRD